MTRSVLAVLFGTFSLRFSTGLTAGLLVFYLARLHDYDGSPVGPIEVALLTATFYLAELVLSPFFGILSDRLGSHRVMQYGPIFGAVAVIMTGFTTNLYLLGVTRWLEGAAAAASIPSILGYIAGATSGDEPLRGRVVARFEAATLAGLGTGIVAAGGFYELFGRNAFFLNAVLYGVSFLIYRYGVDDPRSERPRAEAAGADPTELGVGGVAALAEERFDFGRYRRLLANPAVWLLAPTWIAVNAFIGAWTSQSIFQLVAEPPPGYEDQMLMGGFSPIQVSIGLAAALLVFFAGLFYWGNRFKVLRRTTIIGIGIAGGIVMVGAIWALNHSAAWGTSAQLGLAALTAAALFVLAGATPAALGLLADISELYPEERGAIMGLYSVFLALGQIIGSMLGGVAAEWRGIDGLLIASLGLLVVSLAPLRGLWRTEHLVERETDTVSPPGLGEPEPP